MDSEKRPTGRPSIYTEEVATEICARIADGESLRSICDDDHLPVRSTVLLWVIDGKHKAFSDQYEKARRVQAEILADDLMGIADNGKNDYMERIGEDGEVTGYQVNGEHIQRSRLRVDTRKWYLSKVLPKVYGDKQAIDHTSSDGSMTPKPAIDATKLSDAALAEIMAAKGDES